jgi:hypothetical protein
MIEQPCFAKDVPNEGCTCIEILQRLESAIAVTFSGHWWFGF